MTNELDTSDLQEQLHLRQIVDFPTNERNTLDLILTDLSEQFYLPPQPLPPVGRSTHLSVLWTPAPTTSHHQARAIRTYRPTPDSAIREFGQWITRYPWTEVMTETEVTKKWDNFVATSKQAYETFFPTKSVRIHSADVPWITPYIKNLIHKRNKAWYTNRNIFKRLRNKVINEIVKAKKSYYHRKIHNLKQSNISQWYDKIKSMCGLSKKSTPISCISDLSNSEASEKIKGQFSSICQTLPALDLANLPAYLPSPSPPPIVEQYQVAKRLSSLKTQRSITPVDVPMKLYKEFAPEFSKPLTSIINASLQQSRCPSDWKTSYVTPLPKTTTPQSLGELRPVSITPIPSLICEDFVFEWCYDQIKHLNIHSSLEMFKLHPPLIVSSAFWTISIKI